MSSKSKTKGAQFELLIMRKLREVFEFTARTAGSGGGNEKGDIEFREYLIECKHRKKLPDTQLLQFFRKISEEANDLNKIPLLIYRANYERIKVMFKRDNMHTVVFFDEWFETLKNERN